MNHDEWFAHNKLRNDHEIARRDLEYRRRVDRMIAVAAKSARCVACGRCEDDPRCLVAGLFGIPRHVCPERGSRTLENRAERDTAEVGRLEDGEFEMLE